MKSSERGNLSHTQHQVVPADVFTSVRAAYRHAALLIGSAVVLVTAGTGFALPIAQFSAGSLGLSQVIVPFGPTATFGFDVLGTGLPADSASGTVASVGYLNVVSGSAWLVRNEPIPLTQTLSTERNSVWFTDVGSLVGSTDLSLSAIINDLPYASQPAPDGTWTSATVTPGSFTWAVPGTQGQEIAPTPPPPITTPPPPNPVVTESFLRGGVPDLKQLVDECGPTSTANSLLWLANKYGFKDKLPKKPDGSVDQEALVTALAKAMRPDWTPVTGLPDVEGHKDRGFGGLNGNELFDGKVKYNRDLGLGLKIEGGMLDTEALTRTFDFIRKELKKGQDVEFLIGWPNDGAHWVTVTGYIDAGKDNKTLIVHDPWLANGNNYWKIDYAGKLSSPRGTAMWAVAESVPDGGSLTPALSLLIVGMGVVAGRRARRTRADVG